MRNGESMIPSGRRPDKIEREIEETRARMESTLSSLEASLTPGQLFDRAIGYVKNNDMAMRAGKRVGRTTFEQMKHNPIAFALMGAGVAWWIFGGSGRSKPVRREPRHEPHAYGVDVDLEKQTVVGRPIEPSYAGDFGLEPEQGGAERGIKDKAAERAHEMRDKAAHKAEEARWRAKSRAEEARSMAKSKAEEARWRAKSKADEARVRLEEARGKISGASARAKSSVRDTASSVKQRASGLASGAKTRADDVRRSMRTAYNRASSTGRSAAYKARDRASRAGENLSGQARERPLVFAGIAFALAAGIGALLRPTRREDRLLGPRRDEVLRRADEMGARGVERAREVANRAFEVAHEKARSVENPLQNEAMEAETDEAARTATRTTTTTTTTFETGAGEEIDRSGMAPAPPEVPETTNRMPPGPGSDELRRG